MTKQTADKATSLHITWLCVLPVTTPAPFVRFPVLATIYLQKRATCTVEAEMAIVQLSQKVHLLSIERKHQLQT